MSDGLFDSGLHSMRTTVGNEAVHRIFQNRLVLIDNTDHQLLGLHSQLLGSIRNSFYFILIDPKIMGKPMSLDVSFVRLSAAHGHRHPNAGGRGE